MGSRPSVQDQDTKVCQVVLRAALIVNWPTCKTRGIVDDHDVHSLHAALSVGMGCLLFNMYYQKSSLHTTHTQNFKNHFNRACAIFATDSVSKLLGVRTQNSSWVVAILP